MEFKKGSTACPHCWDDGCIRNVLYSSAVHKDDCAYCCSTNLHGNGIYVCMACFGGFCVSHVEKHLSLNPTHTMYVNLLQLPPKDTPQEDVKDVYFLGVSAPPEYTSAVCCAACKIVFTQPEGLTAECYTQIIDSTSVGTKDAIVAEGVFATRPQCPHLVTLEQLDHSFSQAPAATERCTQEGCECQLNNWMCVTCGAVGCPRKEAGGSGHAILHYLSTQHPVVVKLGTVTPEGADYYCYGCDEEVSDVHFAAHMAHFGIDVRTAVKTAKTLGEMQYDLTSQFDFNKITEAGENLLPVYGPGLTGMRNFGNTCYISSVVQCLLSLTPFQLAFCGAPGGPATPHWMGCQEDPYSCPSCQVEKVANGLLSGEFSKKCNEPWLNGITPREFKRVFAKKHPEFSTGDQQDAQEYLLYLLQELLRRVPVARSPEVPAHPSRIFEMIVERRVECDKCKKVRYTQEKDSCLALVPPVKPPSAMASSQHPPSTSAEDVEAQRPRCSLDACLSAWLDESTVECYCGSCSKPTTYRSTTRLKTFPDTLVLYIRRAYFDPGTVSVKKLDVYVDVPEELDLSNLRSAGPQPGEAFMPAPEQSSPGVGAGGKAAAEAAEVDEMALVTLISMGIDDVVARYALIKTDMNVERAIDYVFSHPSIEAEAAGHDVPASSGEKHSATDSPASADVATDGMAKYKLAAMISHMGASAKTGHYVCHIKDKASGKWVLFNDEKVAESKKPPFSLASLFFFTRE